MDFLGSLIIGLPVIYGLIGMVVCVIRAAKRGHF